MIIMEVISCPMTCNETHIM